MFKHIFLYELKYWFKKPSFYLYAFIFSCIAFIAIVGTAGLFDPHTNNENTMRLVNSPFEINYIIQYFNKFLLFLLPTIIGFSLYKDTKQNIHSILYSFPIKKKDYLLGKFFSSFLIVMIISISLIIAMIIAEHIPGLDPNKIGGFNAKNYLQAFFIYTFPNLLFIGAIIFAIVSYTRNIYSAFFTLIILFFIQNITQNIFNGVLIGVFDPFAQNAVLFETQLWTLEDKNSKFIPIIGTVLYNRMFWLILSAVIFGYAYQKFAFTEHPLLILSKKKKRESKINESPIKNLKIELPKVNYVFSTRQQLKNSWLLSSVHFKNIITSWMFYIISFFGILAVLFTIGKVTNNSEITILPVTNIVLTIPAFFFMTIIMLLTFIYSGMLLNEDKSSKMNLLVDATSVSNFSLLFSKIITIIKMQITLLCIMMVTGIAIQIYNNHYTFEIGQYVFQLFIVQLIGLVIWAFFSIFIHSILKNTYLGIFILLLCWFGTTAIKEVGIDTRIILFNFSEPMQYSDLIEYGNQLIPYFLVKSYWLVFTLILLIVSYLLWNRGLYESFKERISLLKINLNGQLKILLSISLTIFITLGFTIYTEEQKSIELSSKERNSAFNKFEKEFEKYVSIENQPKVTDLDLNIEIFPKENKLKITGESILVNKSKQPIEIVLIKTGFDEETTFKIDKNYEVIDQDTYVNFYVLKLKNKLQSSDSLKLTFNLKTKPNTLFENNSNVLNNGTFFKNDILPRIGYFLNSSKKHPSDSNASNKHYYSIDSDFINLKTTISTSINQTAFAPGYLKNSWSKNNRNYFEYHTKHKIKNSLSFSSGNYKVYEESYKNVGLKIYYHRNHHYNLESMAQGLKKALDYNTSYFGEYQFNEARIIEFPITEGTYASVMGNNIPTSEMRFIASSAEDKIDLSFYTIAHELTHQWWGNQVVPADALGAVLLSESITEYISLNIFEKQFGKQKAHDFLLQHRDRYIKGRTKETEKESPLFLVKGEQQYLSYGKGPLALNALNHHLGKKKLHQILKEFHIKYKDSEVPYPTSLNFIKHLESNTPDSLKYVINDWFKTVTFYDNSINSVNLIPTDVHKYEITIDYTLKKYLNDDENNLLPINEVIEFGVYDKNGELIKLEKVKVNNLNNIHKLILDKKPKKIVLDPNLLLIEKEINDNTFKL